MLLVVGDVSGKGLGAAMTVAAIAGALDNEFSRRPGEVLEHLNRALLLRKGEGFVTCCAAFLEPTGSLTIANAGHLAPYAGGRELPIETDLPLGLAAEVSYTDKRLAIATHDALTFVSDGLSKRKTPSASSSASNVRARSAASPRERSPKPPRPGARTMTSRWSPSGGMHENRRGLVLAATALAPTPSTTPWTATVLQRSLG